jgi:hypothetical protein
MQTTYRRFARFKVILRDSPSMMIHEPCVEKSNAISDSECWNLWERFESESQSGLTSWNRSRKVEIGIEMRIRDWTRNRNRNRKQELWPVYGIELNVLNRIRRQWSKLFMELNWNANLRLMWFRIWVDRSWNLRLKSESKCESECESECELNVILFFWVYGMGMNVFCESGDVVFALVLLIHCFVN